MDKQLAQKAWEEQTFNAFTQEMSMLTGWVTDLMDMYFAGSGRIPPTPERIQAKLKEIGQEASTTVTRLSALLEGKTK
jgi:hypothetical protein